MRLKQRLVLIAVIVPALFLSSDAAGPSSWHIRGSLTEACSCAVPCTCNFGGSPSPHPYCYTMYSYKIAQGKFGAVVLDGLKFGSVDARYGRTVYLDQQARPDQREALMAVAEKLLALKDLAPFYSGQSMTHIATRVVEIVQEADDHGNHLKFGDDGEFRATYIIGRDGKTPVIVRNNTTWAIPEAIKGTTDFYRYRLGRNHFSFQDTNSNQGDFEYDSSQYEQQGTAHCGGKAVTASARPHPEP